MWWSIAAILGGAFPCQKPQNGKEKGAFIDGNYAMAKNSVNTSLRVPWVWNDHRQQLLAGIPPASPKGK